MKLKKLLWIFVGIYTLIAIAPFGYEYLTAHSSPKITRICEDGLQYTMIGNQKYPRYVASTESSYDGTTLSYHGTCN